MKQDYDLDYEQWSLFPDISIFFFMLHYHNQENSNLRFFKQILSDFLKIVIGPIWLNVFNKLNSKPSPW